MNLEKNKITSVGLEYLARALSSGGNSLQELSLGNLSQIPFLPHHLIELLPIVITLHTYPRTFKKPFIQTEDQLFPLRTSNLPILQFLPCKQLREAITWKILSFESITKMWPNLSNERFLFSNELKRKQLINFRRSSMTFLILFTFT